MAELIKLVWDVCCLRRGPQDLPHSPALLALLCVLWLAVQAVGAMLLGLDRDAVAGSLLPLVLNLGVLFLLLLVRNVPNRFVQTATALIGCGLLFLLLSVPIALLAGGQPLTPGQMTPLQILLGLVSLPLLIWKLMIDANIFRHSMNVPFLVAIAIAVMWFIVELALNGAASAPATA